MLGNVKVATDIPADRARQTARRKVIYLKLHPETAAGTAGAEARWNANDKLSFASATSAVSGRDERSVQRDSSRGEKIVPKVLDLIRDTPLDTGTYLDKLKKVQSGDQMKAARRDLAYIRHQEREKTSAVFVVTPSAAASGKSCECGQYPARTRLTG